MHEAATAVESARELWKELGLRDLIFAQVLCVVGSAWVGVAAKLGNAHTLFWLIAMLLYYLPLAAVVVYLNREMPLEGGLYEWARHGFGEFFGFLTGWNLWAYGIVCIPTILFMVPTELAYLVGPTGAWLLGSRLATTSLIGAVLLAISWIAARGLGAGKWLHNAGSGMVLTAYIILLLPRLEAALDELFSGIAGHHTTA